MDLSNFDVPQLQTDMLEAAKAGHEDIVARLLALDPHSLATHYVNSLDDSLLNARAFSWDQEYPLHLAAMNGHDGVVAQILAFSPHTSDVRDSRGRTPLHHAAANGQDKIVARLLAHNPALIDAVSSFFEKMTALHSAAYEGHESTVMQLLNHKPGLLDIKNAHNETALHLAAVQGHVKVVAELLARCPSSLADEDSKGRTPVFCAASKGHQKVVDLFPLTTDQVHRRDGEGNTLLHLVVVANFKPALIRRVWEMNPSALFVADAHGSTPFDNAFWSVNEWAIEHFQWKHSVWLVEEALVNVQRHSNTSKEVRALQRRERRFREVVQGECERALLLSLPRDCVHLIISDFLFIWDNLLEGKNF